MSRPFLSIITINKNNAAGLKETLQSVACQTCDDYEQIIIDGKSSDDSVEVIEELLKNESFSKKLTHWESESDSGIYFAMNKGVNYANGKYCLFLNSGDTLLDEERISYIKNLRPDADIAYFNAVFHDGTKSWTKTYPDELNFLFFYKEYPLNHQNMLIKNSLIKAEPYSMSLSICSDVEFYVKAFVNLNSSFKHYDTAISRFECKNGIGSRDETRALRDAEWQMIKRSVFSERERNILDYVLALEKHETELNRELSEYKNSCKGIFRKLLTLYKKLKLFPRKRNESN